jgi:hypothetical protein
MPDLFEGETYVSVVMLMAAVAPADLSSVMTLRAIIASYPDVFGVRKVEFTTPQCYCAEREHIRPR